MGVGRTGHFVCDWRKGAERYAGANRHFQPGPVESGWKLLSYYHPILQINQMWLFPLRQDPFPEYDPERVKKYKAFSYRHSLWVQIRVSATFLKNWLDVTFLPERSVLDRMCTYFLPKPLNLVVPKYIGFTVIFISCVSSRYFFQLAITWSATLKDALVLLIWGI